MLAVRTQGLGKRYRLGQHLGGPTGGRFSEALVNKARSLLGRSSAATGDASQLWALRDVDFSVERGDIVGIIGRNGSGKSTLLKVLSRITEPTTGRIELGGRVASLLEVGTGFHPELTGRENIYLNGAILGLSRREITARMDAIVAFSGVEGFLDTPVKRFSSGMYVRLAFAVAAHLQPDILVIDEVLAVGDAEFQARCLGTLADMASGGRTVLFVSHNLQAVANLCTRTMVLDHGHLAFDGAVDDGIRAYLASLGEAGETRFERDASPAGSPCHPHLRHVEVGQDGASGASFDMHRDLWIDLEVDRGGEPAVSATIVVDNEQGVRLCHSTEEFSADAAHIARATRRRCVIPAHVLNAGDYRLTVALSVRASGQVFEKLEDVLRFNVRFSGPGTERVERRAFGGATAPGLLRWSGRPDS